MTLIHLREVDGGVVRVPEAEAEYSVDVPDEKVAAWAAARAAYDEALAAFSRAQAELSDLYDAEEEKAFAALPPPDPNAPPPGPIRDLFPCALSTSVAIRFGAQS